MTTLTPTTEAVDSPSTTDRIERNRFYDLLWGDTVGFVYIAAGATGAEIVARGWPLEKGESDSPDDVHMLLWTKDTHDEFEAAGRPHTGTVFAWPRERKKLDREVVKLTEEYQAVYCHKFVYESRTDAKYGNPPKHAQIVLVEDAPDELPAYMPPFSFILQTSDYSQQGVYRFPTPQPWAKMKTLAECTKDRIPGADSGGPNPAQFTRIPTTTNTKEKAVRFRVRLIEGQGSIEVATLACAVLPGGMSGLSATHSQSQRRPSNGKGGPGADDPDWCAAVEAAVGWRGYLWKDAEPWKGGPQLRDDGTPKALKEDHRICRVLRGEMSWPEMASQWGGKDATGSGFTYHLVGSLYLVGCEIPQIIALVEVLDPQARSKGDSWFYHQNLWGCLYRTGNEHQGWAILMPDIPRRPWKRFAARRVETIPDVERSRRGRKPGAQASMVDLVAALLVPGEEVTRKQLRDRLSAATGRDVCPRSMTNYMRPLSARGLVARNAARGEHYRVVGGVASNSTLINSPINASVDAIVRGGVASNRGGSNSHRFGASQCEVDGQVDHTPPVPALPSCSGVADEQSHTATLVVAPEPNGGCVLPPHVDDLPVILTNPALVACTDSVMAAAPVALLPEQPAPALVAGNDSPIAPNTDAHHEWLRRAAVAPRPAPVTPERLAEIIARIRNEQTASPEPELIPEQPAPVPASTDSTNTPQPAPALDHRAWLRRARTTPHAAPPTPERLAEIIARLRASSPPSQPDDTPQPAPEPSCDGLGAAIEDCAAHDEKATLQEGSGATEQTLSTHSHVRDVIAPQKPVQPAHEQTIATVVARIEIARTEIRYTKQETLNRETGELVEKATKAMKHRVRAIVSDVPDALFDAAWKKVNDVWLTYRADLERRDAIGLAQAARSAARQHADAVRKDSPRVKFYAAQDRIAAEICARRGVDPLDPTGKKKLRATQAQAKAQAKAQAERRGKVASLFVPSVAQRPLFEYTPVACAD